MGTAPRLVYVVMNMPKGVGLLLTRAGREYRTVLAAKLAPLGLYPGQEALLAELWADDGLPQTTLAGRLGVERPTVSKIVRRLEATGLVERRPDIADARVTQIYLTQAGRGLQEPVREALAKVEAALLAGLDDDEKKAANRMLETIISHLQGTKGGDEL